MKRKYYIDEYDGQVVSEDVYNQPVSKWLRGIAVILSIAVGIGIIIS